MCTQREDKKEGEFKACYNSYAAYPSKAYVREWISIILFEAFSFERTNEQQRERERRLF